MRLKFISLLSIISMLNFAFSMGQSKEKLQEYIDFINKEKTQPIDYIFNQFDSGKRVVVICERDHAEITQYQLFSKLIKDKRFDSIKYIFTELGSSTLSDSYNHLSKENYSETIIKSKIDSIYRNLIFYPYWEKYNFYDFLLNLQLYNKEVSNKREIYFSDVPFSWNNMTSLKYKNFTESILPQRDSIIASQIISKIEYLDSCNKDETKAIIILNYRHGFGNVFYNNKKAYNCGSFLREYFGEKICFIGLNTLGIESVDKPDVQIMLQGGLWDAAFKICNKKTLAINLKNTPFGDCQFDLFPFYKDKLKYADVFDGFIYYLPIDEHIMCYEIPHLFNKEFKKEYLRRVEIAGYNKFQNKLYLYQIKIFGKHCNKYESMKIQKKILSNIIKEYYKK